MDTFADFDSGARGAGVLIFATGVGEGADPAVGESFSNAVLVSFEEGRARAPALRTRTQRAVNVIDLEVGRYRIKRFTFEGYCARGSFLFDRVPSYLMIVGARDLFIEYSDDESSFVHTRR